MDDKALWELCVSSGFSASEWWPKQPDDKYGLALHPEHGWLWMCAPFSGGTCKPENARARILAGLLEWATTGGRYISYADSEMPGDDNVRVSVDEEEGMDEYAGDSSSIELALLECYRQWNTQQKGSGDE